MSKNPPSMSRRLQKQFLYGLLYVSVLLGAILLIYVAFVRPAPGCGNGRRDAGEEGVDCGGACANVCVPEDVRAIEIIGPVRIVQPNSRIVELAAKIQNSNVAIAADAFPYRFDIIDETGRVADSVSGESFIYGGEVKYLIAIKTGVAYRPASVELTIGAPHWVDAENYKKPVVGGIQDRLVRLTSSTVEVSGKVANKDIVALDTIVVTTFFYNDLGLLAGVSETELDGAAPEERKNFTVIHPAISGVVPERTEIFITASR